jgi:hypothetical protein
MYSTGAELERQRLLSVSMLLLLPLEQRRSTVENGIQQVIGCKPLTWDSNYSTRSCPV